MEEARAHRCDAGATMLLAGCSGSTDGTGGAAAPSESPTSTPTESSLTSAEQVSLDFFRCGS